jgi:hypothetical protein
MLIYLKKAQNTEGGKSVKGNIVLSLIYQNLCKMRTLFNILFLNFIIPNLSSQELILNGSFEESNICKEFAATCSPVAWKNLNLAANTYITGRGKNGKASGVVIHKKSAKNYRTYIKTRLLCPLIKDNLYDVSFYIKSPNRGMPDIGVLFTDHELFSPTWERLDIKPSIDFIDTCFEKPFKSQGWNLCHFTYKADGGEAYFLIGNFTPDEEEDAPTVSASKDNETVYYLDDVSVKSLSETLIPCTEMDNIKEEIILDIERHTAYEKEISRLKLKEAKLNGLPYKPNDAFKRKIIPCSGDEWLVDYHIDTFQFSNSAFDKDFLETKTRLLNNWENTKDSCIGITVLAYTNAGENATESNIALKKAHEIAVNLSTILGVEKSMICVQEKNINVKAEASVFGGFKNEATDVKEKAAVLFLMKE